MRERSILKPKPATVTRALLCNISIICGLSFGMLTLTAMLFYPGGTSQNHHESHYLFLRNPFSDLGRTRVFNGRSNLISMTLFSVGMICGGIGLIAFFIAFSRYLRHSKIARLLSRLGLIAGVVAGLGYLGVGCTPWDLYMNWHIFFVFLAFKSLLVGMILNLFASMFEKPPRYRLIAPFVVFISLLSGYIVLLTSGVQGGPGSDAAIQAVSQKLIVYSAILTVILQARELRDISS